MKSIPDGGYKAYGGEDVIFFCQVEAVPAVFDIIWTDNRVCGQFKTTSYTDEHELVQFFETQIQL